MRAGHLGSGLTAVLLEALRHPEVPDGRDHAGRLEPVQHQEVSQIDAKTRPQKPVAQRLTRADRAKTGLPRLPLAESPVATLPCRRRHLCDKFVINNPR